MPVWLPNRISSGVWADRGSSGGALAARSLGEKPARKPFSQSRWAALNGAFSGMKGTLAWLNVSTRSSSRTITPPAAEKTGLVKAQRIPFEQRQVFGVKRLDPVRVFQVEQHLRVVLVAAFRRDESARSNTASSQGGIFGFSVRGRFGCMKNAASESARFRQTERPG